MFAPETLLLMPRWSKQDWAWEKLTADDLFFRALSEAARQGRAVQAEESIKTWQPFVEKGTEHVHYQWQVMQSLLACLQIAMSDGAASPAHESFQPGRSIMPLDAASAWDAVITFRGQSRPVAHVESTSVLLLVNGDGMIAQLTLERLADEGRGMLYPDPARMAFVERRQDFQEAEQSAVAYVQATGLWQKDQGPDVRWRLERRDGKPLSRLEGGSAGGAFALGLAKLFTEG